MGPPPLSQCAPVTVLTLSNLQGGGPFPSLLPLLPPSTAPLILLLLVPERFCPRFSPICQVLKVSGQECFLPLPEGQHKELRKQNKSYCLNPVHLQLQAVWKCKLFKYLNQPYRNIFTAFEYLFQAFEQFYIISFLVFTLKLPY